MKAHSTSTLEELRIAGRFEGLRETLYTDRYARHLEKPLAYWALPSDRRLPLVLLGRTLRELLETPFSELSATRGIGRKKICSLVSLLARAAQTDPEELVCVNRIHGNGNGHNDGHGNGNGNGHAHGESAPSDSNGFDPENVSEVVWSQWRTTVVRHHLQTELLGRLTPSLKNLTRSSWQTPLGDYTHKTLTEIRELRTHGEKRVRAIIEVFHGLHKITAEMGELPHLAVRIQPRRIEQIEQWIRQAVNVVTPPSDAEVLERLIHPMVDQLRIDAPSQIVWLAENRLGLTGPITSVRETARTMGLTRARVYQLLTEVQEIFAVRWPAGPGLLHGLSSLVATSAAEQEGHECNPARLAAAAELVCPRLRRQNPDSAD